MIGFGLFGAKSTGIIIVGTTATTEKAAKSPTKINSLANVIVVVNSILFKEWFYCRFVRSLGALIPHIPFCKVLKPRRAHFILVGPIEIPSMETVSC